MTVHLPPARAARRDPDAPRDPASGAPLLSLQVLRAAAAGLVVLHHAAYDADTIAARLGAAPFRLDRFVDLTFGVDLFFVLSGFVMASTARGYGSARGAAAFMARRVVRVAPLYWLLTALVLVGGALAPGLLNAPAGGPGVVAGSVLFIPVRRPDGGINPVLGQGWTLDYEMFFYALFALSMLMRRSLAAPALAGAILGLALLGRAAAMPGAALATWTDGLLIEFLLGLGLGWLGLRGRRCGPAAAAALVAAGCVAAAALGPLTAAHAAPAWLRSGVPAAAVVAGCALGPRWPAAAATVALAAVGDASYSLYLSHPFVVRLLRQAWLAMAPAGAPAGWLYLCVACLSAVAGALALHRWVERPMTLWLQRRVPPPGVDRRPILPEAAEAARRG